MVAKRFLFAFLLLAFVLRLFAAKAPNIVHPDEVFQTEEPAHRLAYGYGVVTWEWREGIRSWIFPAFLAAIMRTTDWMGPHSLGYLRGIAVVMSLFSLTTVWFGFICAERARGVEAGLIAAGCCALWYELVIFGARTLNEVFATHLLLPGLYLGVYAKLFPERQRLFLAGILCGAGLGLRIQLVPTVVFAVLYFCRSRWRQRALPVACGLILPILVFGIVDMFTWSYPFQSFVRYFWINLIEHRSEAYGVQPWYWYVLALVNSLGPVLLFAVIGALRSPFLGIVTLITVISHSLINHKEPRFLYPVIPIIITLAAIGVVDIAHDIMAFKESQWRSGITIGASLILCALASWWMAPRFQYWSKDSGVLTAFNRLSYDSRTCGLGLYGISWVDSGGYTHLHQNVPIILLTELRGNENVRSFNTLIAIAGSSEVPADFHMVGCWDGSCLYRRSGSCTVPRPEEEINGFLRRTGG